MNAIENPVLNDSAATEVQARTSKRQQRRERHTLESQPQSNRAARSTPIAVNYPAIVRECAHHKVAEGESYVSRKGKSHLRALVCAAVASQLGLSKEQAKDLASVTLENGGQDGETILRNIDAAIVAVFSEFGTRIATEYDKITYRSQFAFDRVKEIKNEAGATVRNYEFGLAGTMRGERQTRDVSEARRTLNVLKAKHEKRLNFMQDHRNDPHPDTGVSPRFTDKAIKVQMDRVKDVLDALAQLPEFKGAVTPEEPRDVAEHYRQQK